jgi:hypothetical protein
VAWLVGAFGVDAVLGDVFSVAGHHAHVAVVDEEEDSSSSVYSHSSVRVSVKTVIGACSRLLNRHRLPAEEFTSQRRFGSYASPATRRSKLVGGRMVSK